jgi:hypothetical protein
MRYRFDLRKRIAPEGASRTKVSGRPEYRRLASDATFSHPMLNMRRATDTALIRAYLELTRKYGDHHG